MNRPSDSPQPPTGGAKKAGPSPEVSGWMQLARSFDAHHRRMAAMLAAHDLTGPQFDVLATAHRCHGLSQQEIAGNLLVTKGNIALVIDNLERDGLIQRRADNTDARIKRIHLTPAGRAKLAVVFRSHSATVANLWSCFTPAEIRTLTSLLRALEHNCNAAADTP